MSKGPVRWGLLSTARINERLIPPLRRSERSNLLAVASRDEKRARAYAAKWNIPRAYGSYDALLADSEIDVVYVSLPNSDHAEWSIKCARAGKHILCEKPLALIPEDVERMAGAARESGVILQEAAMYRFHPQTHKVRELVAAGVIGELRFIQCNFGFTLINDPDIRREPEKGGGALWDIGSYPVSFARTMAGENPVAVAGWQLPSDRGVDMDFGGQLHFSAGILAQFTCSFQTLTHWEAKLIGSQGYIHLDLPWQNQVGAKARVEVVRAGVGATTTFGDSREQLAKELLVYENCDAYFCEVEATAASILDDAPPTITPEDSRGNVATLVALYTAARENRIVALRERD